ncbi:ATP-dependent DNA helicase [Enterococcus dispar]|uniref:ATP-dependent DNA helicase n=1 Tax=Enterococcus dispar TaxID=44009 RepID=UPI00189F4C22|nr:ATP-dependent DNA helicase [Enterococcus dispar]MCU7356072.1 ATP-dependent DNA helicase [Enterococcus dispar]MDT2704876.1 ATP-dependent DNA helicase [Enterococcus dispar]
MQSARVSVRKLVEFILRSGSIDSRHTSSHTAQEGAKIHRRLQKAAGEDYQKEVFLKYTLKVAKDELTVEGRADGIFQDEAGYVIDEIKTSETPFEELASEQKELFFYQGMVYAYIYALQQELATISVQLTYFQTIEEKITKEVRIFQFSELADFFSDLINEYQKWLEFQNNWRRVRNTSLQLLQFPFDEFRTGQRELAVAAYKTLKTQQRLFVEAPTGTGKTISTLFPALKALGEENNDRIFYLTAKTITRQVAEDALKALSAQSSAEVKSVTLTAKDKICFLTERNCTPEHCPFANGYYDRINEGLWDLLHHENQITRSVIEVYAKKHTLCPFELSLDVSLWCDVIIGDYNYLFDPTVYLRRFFEEENENYYFLIDEAHNLVSRSKEMYSAAINRQSGEHLLNMLPKQDHKLRRSLTKLDDEFTLIETAVAEKKDIFFAQTLPADSLNKQLYKVSEKLQEWLGENPENKAQETALNYYFTVLNYLKISELYDDHYITTVTRQYQDVTIKQFCLDPAPFLEQMLAKGKGAVLFSASFTPLGYYQDVLGGGADALRYRLPSPFPPEHQALLLLDYIPTTYKQRENSLSDLVAAIYEMVTAKNGNYFVFLPSYAYLDLVAETFKTTYPEIRAIIQNTELTETQREDFLAEFVAEPATSLVGFCVLGGVFSEGIDLKGTRLIGSMVVTVGLPQINHEQELIKEYYGAQKGFDYAYRLPGMNKVLQAAGRVIRDQNDFGVVLLVDQRFERTDYQVLFPAHWRHFLPIHNRQELKKNLLSFWE